MGRIYEKRSEKGRRGRKVERQGQHQGPMEKMANVSVLWSDFKAILRKRRTRHIIINTNLVCFINLIQNAKYNMY